MISTTAVETSSTLGEIRRRLRAVEERIQDIEFAECKARQLRMEDQLRDIQQRLAAVESKLKDRDRNEATH